MHDTDPHTPLPSWVVGLIAAGVALVMFASLEFAEDAWPTEDGAAIPVRVLRLAWAVTASLAVAAVAGGLVAWQRRRAAAALRRLAAQHQELIDSLHLGILLIGQDGRIHYANAAVKDIIGDVVGAEYSAVFAEPVGANRDSAPARALSEGGRAEEIRQGRNGRLYRLVAAPLRGSDGQRLAVETVVDVTSERELRDQLVVSEKLAAIGQLAAGIAHEIRTPLSTIRVAAYDASDLLGGQRDGAAAATAPAKADVVPQAREALELIERNAVRCNDIILTLLDFARESPSEPEEVDVDEVIGTCLQLARKSMSLQGVMLERTGDRLPTIWGRADDLRQVFSNVIINAVQAMPGGGILRIVSTCDDDSITVRVRDTGCGIPRQNLGRIFDPFFTTKEPGEGTGLGLSVCRRAVERVRGSISVQSELGIGSEFTITLPIRAVEAAAP